MDNSLNEMLLDTQHKTPFPFRKNNNISRLPVGRAEKKDAN